MFKKLGRGGEMTQTLYAHMNKRKKNLEETKKKKKLGRAAYYTVIINFASHL
jgi:hypothetical protein